MSEKKEIGKVRWFDPRKGYGFIDPKDSDESVFVHYSDIDSDDEYRQLVEGDEVSFTITEQKDGKLKAQNVLKLEKFED